LYHPEKRPVNTLAILLCDQAALRLVLVGSYLWYHLIDFDWIALDPKLAENETKTSNDIQHDYYRHHQERNEGRPPFLIPGVIHSAQFLTSATLELLKVSATNVGRLFRAIAER
jgi:hypothetical protein